MSALGGFRICVKLMEERNVGRTEISNAGPCAKHWRLRRTEGVALWLEGCFCRVALEGKEPTWGHAEEHQ